MFLKLVCGRLSFEGDLSEFWRTLFKTLERLFKFLNIQCQSNSLFRSMEIQLSEFVLLEYKIME